MRSAHPTRAAPRQQHFIIVGKLKTIRASWNLIWISAASHTATRNIKQKRSQEASHVSWLRQQAKCDCNEMSIFPCRQPARERAEVGRQRCSSRNPFIYIHSTATTMLLPISSISFLLHYASLFATSSKKKEIFRLRHHHPSFPRCRCRSKHKIAT